MAVLGRTELEDLLCGVQKPVRYIGNEWNSIVRDGPEIEIRVALAYPDSYEIGMSHLGYRILYSELNRMDGVAAERVFAAWPDFEEALREAAIRQAAVSEERKVGYYLFDESGSRVSLR